MACGHLVDQFPDTDSPLQNHESSLDMWSALAAAWIDNNRQNTMGYACYPRAVEQTGNITEQSPMPQVSFDPQENIHRLRNQQRRMIQRREFEGHNHFQRTFRLSRSPPPYRPKEQSDPDVCGRRTPPPSYSLATRSQDSNCDRYRTIENNNQRLQNCTEGNLLQSFNGPSAAYNYMHCAFPNHNFDGNNIPDSGNFADPPPYFHNSRYLTPSPPTDGSDASVPYAPLWSDPESLEDVSFLPADRWTGSSTNCGEGAVGRRWNTMPTPPVEDTAFSGRQFPVSNGGWRGEPSDGDQEVLLPADPRGWDAGHISRWIDWIVSTFPVAPILKELLPLNGMDLCGLTIDDLFRRTGERKTADVLYTHLAHLKQAIGHVPLSDSAPIAKVAKKVAGADVSNSTSGHIPLYNSAPNAQVANNVVGVDASGSTSGIGTSILDGLTIPEAVKLVLGVDVSDYDTEKAILIKCFGNRKFKATRTGSKGGGQIHLWQYLLDLLFHPRENGNIISWEGDDGVFRLTDHDEVARRWGVRKSKPNMNHDKLTRAMRYYYDKKILEKVQSKKYTYKFLVKGVLLACQPTGISDTCFIQPGFDLATSGQTLRNFHFGGA